MSNAPKQPRLQVPLIGKPREKLKEIATVKQWSEAKTATHLLTEKLKTEKVK